MATSFNSLGGGDDDVGGFPEDFEDLDAALPPPDAVVEQVAEAPVQEAGGAASYEMAGLEDDTADGKPLLEVRGFYVSSGPGVYDGATRENEEPRDSHFVDVQDYETGEIKRVWGVVLGEVMTQATGVYGLQPGSRIHLVQQGKREIVTDYLDSTKTQQFRSTYANGWMCLPDRGPLPSHLAHMMAGVNVDRALDRIALRYDMGLDDDRLQVWKLEQKRLIKALGDDPQTVRAWLARRSQLSTAEEESLVAKAVELAGYGDADPVRRKQEIEMRMSAIQLMQPEQRYDYLMAAAKPHLMEANQKTEERLAKEIVAAIEQVTIMATAGEHPDSHERKAMRSALIQSVEGLTLQQQMDYIAQRREHVLKNLTESLQGGVTPEASATSHRVSRTDPIDVTGLSQEEYQLLLEQRFALAESAEEKAAMLKQEIETRAKAQEMADAEFEALDALYQRFSRERDVDALAYVAGQAARALASTLMTGVMPKVRTTFEALGGLGAWRRSGCKTGLSDLHDALHAAKQSDVYQGFLKDPIVVAACGEKSPEAMVAEHRDFARTDVIQRHLAAQETAQPAEARGADQNEHKGLWAQTMGAAHRLADRVSHMAPDHLIKKGALDNDWIKGMQAGLREFGEELKATLMPERVMEQMQELIASILASLRMMIELAKEMLGVGKSRTVDSSPSSLAMEP